MVDGLTLGRDPSSDYEIEDPGVSRRHASLGVDGDRALIEDLGSANGTYLNGERIEAQTEVVDGDVVQLGSTAFDVSIDDGATAGMGAGAATVAATPPPPPEPRAPAAEPPRIEPPPSPRREPSPEPRVGAAVARRAGAPINWQAIAAIVLGPLSIVLLAFGTGVLFYLSLPAAVVAIGLGSAGKRRSDNRGDSMRSFAVAGQVFGIVGTILAAIVILILIAVSAATDVAADSLGSLIDEIRAEIEGEIDSALPGAPENLEIPGNLPEGVEPPQ